LSNEVAAGWESQQSCLIMQHADKTKCNLFYQFSPLLQHETNETSLTYRAHGTKLGWLRFTDIPRLEQEFDLSSEAIAMTSIKHIVASLAVGAALMFPAAMGAQAAPVNATAQKNLGVVSETAGSQVEQVRRRGHRHRGHRHRHRGHRHGRSHFWLGAPFLAAPFFYGGYYDYSPRYYGGGNYCYRECREFYGPRYCRRHWRRFC
jgi:hypothetical protein